MPIEIKIKGIEKLDSAEKYYKSAEGILHNLLVKASNKFAVDAQKNIRENYLSGPRPEKLGVVTGRLRSSIVFNVEDAEEIMIRFGSNVEYAAIHEFSGNAGPGHKVYIKARPYMRPGIMDKLPQFKTDLAEILKRVADGKPNG